MSILVTGGAGYIGSHTCVELLTAGYDVVVLDNLCNSCEESLQRVREITGKDVTFYQADLLDEQAVNHVFDNENIEAVIHFAGLKAVGESVSKPLEYYHNNVTGTLILCDCMRRHGVKNIVFSSSATVYGSPKTVPIREDFALHVTNPYGRTKLMLEEILTDLHTSDPAWNVILLRYFNPIGAHKSGRIGENPRGIPNNREESRQLQTFYKDTLFHEFDHRCPICDIHLPHMLIASHIKPFRDCAHLYEPIDNNNGLLLCRNHDYLFDQGYISFLDDGRLLVCSELQKEPDHREVYHLPKDFHLDASLMTPERKLFLAYHRKNLFRR